MILEHCFTLFCMVLVLTGLRAHDSPFQAAYIAFYMAWLLTRFIYVTASRWENP